MNQGTDSQPTRAPRWRIHVAIATIGGAFALALYLQRPEPRSVAAKPSLETPDSVLAVLPNQMGDSASEKAVTDAVSQARKTPSSASAWAAVGDALAQRLRDSGDQTYYEFAGKAYGQALAQEPLNVAALNGMAWVTGVAHQFDESIGWANKSLAVTPENADAYGILGDASVELGDYDAAFGHYQKMMDLRPDLSSWSRGAYLLWLTGDTLKAGNLMEQAIRAGSAFAENTAWCRAKLATMYFHAGSFAAAAQVLEPSLRERSKNPHVLLAAARTAAATQDFEIARQYYQLMLEEGPQHDALVGLGDIHAARGETKEAEIYYQKVEALHATNRASGVHDHMQMALFLADHDRNLVEAMRLAEQHKVTHNVLEADTLAWVYFKNGENAKAIEAIKLALSRNTPDSAIHYHAGMIALKAGDLQSAQRHLQTALALNPRFSILQAPLAMSALERIANRKARPLESAAALQTTGTSR